MYTNSSLSSLFLLYFPIVPSPSLIRPFLSLFFHSSYSNLSVPLFFCPLKTILIYSCFPPFCSSLYISSLSFAFPHVPPLPCLLFYLSLCPFPSSSLSLSREKDDMKPSPLWRLKIPSNSTQKGKRLKVEKVESGTSTQTKKKRRKRRLTFVLPESSPSSSSVPHHEGKEGERIVEHHRSAPFKQVSPMKRRSTLGSTREITRALMENNSIGDDVFTPVAVSSGLSEDRKEASEEVRGEEENAKIARERREIGRVPNEEKRAGPRRNQGGVEERKESSEEERRGKKGEGVNTGRMTDKDDTAFEVCGSDGVRGTQKFPRGFSEIFNEESLATDQRKARRSKVTIVGPNERHDYSATTTVSQKHQNQDQALSLPHLTPPLSSASSTSKQGAHKIPRKDSIDTHTELEGDSILTSSSSSPPTTTPSLSSTTTTTPLSCGSSLSNQQQQQQRQPRRHRQQPQFTTHRRAAGGQAPGISALLNRWSMDSVFVRPSFQGFFQIFEARPSSSHSKPSASSSRSSSPNPNTLVGLTRLGIDAGFRAVASSFVFRPRYVLPRSKWRSLQLLMGRAGVGEAIVDQMFREFAEMRQMRAAGGRGGGGGGGGGGPPGARQKK